ncbi:DUF6371 domain-containing protein [Robertkochia aurantiaca]|uniref:DUF6371 domain-containing protein n=1 Tax=Robertkochia aurantiaca TaxID=2873700 RepID=UPI001CCA8A5A|nr:DUF6371 domain-containing protein [Robertkochia sp. 3YJGBD-33]
MSRFSSKKSRPYILEPYQRGGRNRFSCPNCKRKKSFTRYIRVDTREYIHETVGRCDKEKRCGYHRPPSEYYNLQGISSPTINYSIIKIKSDKNLTPSYIPSQYFSDSLRRRYPNYFSQYLLDTFKTVKARVKKVLEDYRIGNTNHFKGGTVFWQIDGSNRIRTGKIMLYNPATGKRVKDRYARINWMHSVLNIPDFNLSQVYFGTHLLKRNSNATVGLVESEKTAIIAAIAIPEIFWLATGGINNINQERNQCLVNRSVILVPDADATEDWKNREHLFNMCKSVRTSSFIELHTSPKDKIEGIDLADIIIENHKAK